MSMFLTNSTGCLLCSRASSQITLLLRTMSHLQLRLIRRLPAMEYPTLLLQCPAIHIRICQLLTPIPYMSRRFPMWATIRTLRNHPSIPPNMVPSIILTLRSPILRPHSRSALPISPITSRATFHPIPHHLMMGSRSHRLIIMWSLLPSTLQLIVTHHPNILLRAMTSHRSIHHRVMTSRHSILLPAIVSLPNTLLLVMINLLNIPHPVMINLLNIRLPVTNNLPSIPPPVTINLPNIPPPVMINLLRSTQAPTNILQHPHMIRHPSIHHQTMFPPIPIPSIHIRRTITHHRRRSCP